MGNKGKEEKNLLLEGILNLEMLLMPYERFTYNDLLRELEVDYFAGYEELLPVMLMTTEDPVMERTGRRLFLELYREQMEQEGARSVVERTISLLREERKNWQKRMQRVQKVREKEGLLALKERVREETEQPPFVE